MARGFCGDLRGRLRMVLREADALEQAADFLARILDLQMFEGQLHGCGLIVGIKNFEIARKAEPLRFSPQEPRRKRVKRSDPRIVECLPLAHQKIADSLLHLRRGFIGERDGQDRVSGHALFDQVRDPVGNRARFPRPRSGENQNGTFKSGCGFVLSGIQFVKKRHNGRRACLERSILSDEDALGKYGFRYLFTHYPRGIGGAGFSLRVLVLAKANPRRLKPAPLTWMAHRRGRSRKRKGPYCPS